MQNGATTSALLLGYSIQTKNNFLKFQTIFFLQFKKCKYDKVMFVFCFICQITRKTKIIGHSIFYTYCKWNEMADFFTKSIIYRAGCVKVVVAIPLRKKIMWKSCWKVVWMLKNKLVIFVEDNCWQGGGELLNTVQQ